MKYVMFTTNSGGQQKSFPVIFPNQLVHADIVEALTGTSGFEEVKIVSAGEVTVECSCGGNSPTLGVDSRSEVDADIINTMDYLHGLEGAADALPPSVLSVLKLKNQTNKD